MPAAHAALSQGGKQIRQVKGPQIPSAGKLVARGVHCPYFIGAHWKDHRNPCLSPTSFAPLFRRMVSLPPGKANRPARNSQATFHLVPILLPLLAARAAAVMREKAVGDLTLHGGPSPFMGSLHHEPAGNSLCRHLIHSESQ
jgi:hypothetical protein